MATVIAIVSIGAPRALAIEPSGTFIQVSGSPAVYRVIGGAAIHVDSCAPLNGCPGIVQVSSLNGYASKPRNGSYIHYANGPNAGWIGVFVGGTPIHVDSCAPLNGCPGWVNIDAGGADDYIRSHPTPANGSFVIAADGPDAGGVSRTAGGALIPVSDCSALGSCAGYVTMDAGGVSDYERAHPIPADGTMLLGVPSASTWEVLAGQRVAVGPSQAAVALNDASIAAIPVASSGSSGTSSQHLRRLHVKLRLRWRWNRGRTQLVRIAVLKGRRRFTVRISCTGPGCPRRAIVARSAHGLQPLEGRVYRASDRLVIRVSAPGRSPERGLVVIRYGRKPRAKLLR